MFKAVYGMGGGGGRGVEGEGGISFGEGKGAFLLVNPKTDFDPRFAGFGGRKEREIQSWFVPLVTFRKSVQYA